ncbi:MAG: thiol peroxidase [Firmicutes bacterium]|nr:thiol peroxidase [Bacillota bacterium]
MHGKEVKLYGNELELNTKAPDFTLIDNDLNKVSLQDFGNQVKLISVVPSLDTGICDQQTRRFNQEIVSYPNAVVITVSVDLPFAQKRWCGASGLDNVITLSDHFDVNFGKAYGVLIEDLRLLSRAIFVLDQDNTVVYHEYLPEVGKHPDYEKALAALKSLTS